MPKRGRSMVKNFQSSLDASLSVARKLFKKQQKNQSQTRSEKLLFAPIFHTLSSMGKHSLWLQVIPAPWLIELDLYPVWPQKNLWNQHLKGFIYLIYSIHVKIWLEGYFQGVICMRINALHRFSHWIFGLFAKTCDGRLMTFSVCRIVCFRWVIWCVSSGLPWNSMRL